MSSATISEAMDAARKFIANTADRYTYINREMALLDYNSDIASAKSDGRIDLMRNMLAAGLTTIEKIKEAGLLTPSELAALS